MALASLPSENVIVKADTTRSGGPQNQFVVTFRPYSASRAWILATQV
jgi:hypothetical protein